MARFLQASSKTYRLSHVSLSKYNFSNIIKKLVAFWKCWNLTTLVLTLNYQGEKILGNGIQSFKRVLAIVSYALKSFNPSWLRTFKELDLLDLSWN